MKRLVAAGSGPIFQLCRVFRNGELSRRHNPEFTMLEWYRPNWTYHQLMSELDALVQWLLKTEKADRITYAELFLEYIKLDPHTASVSQMRNCASEHGIDLRSDLGEDLDAWRDLLLTHLVEPHLGLVRPVFVFDYPSTQAALARTRAGNVPVAERFELYYRGVELANGYQELTDAMQQRARFNADVAARRASGLPHVPFDERLIAALAAVVPDCAGVAVGVDRLFMLAEGGKHIGAVMAFSWDCA